MVPPSRTFKHLLYWLFTATRGGTNRGRIIEVLLEEPMNTNQLRQALDLDFRTVKHHLEVLENNDLVSSMGNNYGRMYFTSEKLMNNIELFGEVWKGVSDKLKEGEDEK
jgi:DNA-binding transcriptional ArsR family regulator